MAKKHHLQTKLALLLLPLSWLYSALIFLRKKMYDCGILKKYASEVPTICIGNISWGGTGKSPLTDYLVTELHALKRKCVILTRGYKSELPRYPFLLNNLTLEALKQENINPFETKNHDEQDNNISLPDEAVMILKKHPKLEIIISSDRVLGARRVSAFADLAKSKQSHLIKDHTNIVLESNPAHIYADFILMDDGFQHLKMCTDYNLVLLDKDDFYPHDFISGLFSKTYSWNKQIPLGTWREPKNALNRADIFIIKCPEEEWQMIREYALTKLAPFKKPLFVFEMLIESLDYVFNETGESKDCDVHSLQVTKIPYALVCAVANPKQVEESLTRLLGYAPSKTIFFPDHANYVGYEDLLKNTLDEMFVICTEKDAVKLAQKNLVHTKYPLLVTSTRLRFFDSAFYNREEDISNALTRTQTFFSENDNQQEKERSSLDEMLCCQTKEDIYKQHEHEFSQSIADVLKPVDPYALDDEFDPEYYKYQLHNTPIFPCHKKLENRFSRKAPQIELENKSDFDHWLACNIFTIIPTKKLYKDYIS